MTPLTTRLLTWLLATLSILLLAASLNGHGQGALDSGLLAHPIWSWTILIGGISAATALSLHQNAPPSPNTTRAPSRPPARRT